MVQTKTFGKTLFNLAVPIFVQELFINALSFVDVVMIGQLGETEVAAVGLANQVFLLCSLILFGINSGASIYMAQYWGKRDIKKIHYMMGLGLKLSLAVVFFFFIIVFFLPEHILGIFTQDELVIQHGCQYLQIAAFSYFPFAVTLCFAASLRSMENTRLPMISSVISFSLNTGINYVLISGKFGFPALGVQGAAAATLISRIIEMLILTGTVYIKKNLAAIQFIELFKPDFHFMRQYLKTSFPVIVNDCLYAVSSIILSIIFARMGTTSIAALNITLSIHEVSFVFVWALQDACAVMIGNQIGAGNNKLASSYAVRILLIGGAGSIFVGMAMVLTSESLIGFYNVSLQTGQIIQNLLIISGCTLILRALNSIMVVGILRSGGDTRYPLVAGLLTKWGFSIPLAALGAFVFNLDPGWVYLLSLSDEVIKLILFVFRFHSGKWINNLVKIPGQELTVETV